MANLASAPTRQLRELVLSSASAATGASSESEYFTASLDPPDPTGHAIASSSPPNSARTTETESTGRCETIKAKIERSKSHWSTLAEYSDDSSIQAAVEEDNKKFFKTLQRKWGHFFWTEAQFRNLILGKKFAEGAQGELHEADVEWVDPDDEYFSQHKREWVLKVFKTGISLRHLQSQWPRAYLKFHGEAFTSKGPKSNLVVVDRYYCNVFRGVLLNDGRFAFLMIKEGNDLRGVIDELVAYNSHGSPPFPRGVAHTIMYQIARGVEWLHKHNIVHRDLKASNVLVTKFGEKFGCVIADFECSIGVVGTGLWRAPEILEACMKRVVQDRPQVFSKEADVYSYGMTCYEVLTGKVPFEGRGTTIRDVVDGQRPEVPKEYVDRWARELLRRCWDSVSTSRPSLEEILEVLSKNSVEVRAFKAAERY